MLFRFPRLVHLMKAQWEESKHPRADNGQFGSGSGGSKKPKPSKTKRKMERRAESAGQETLGSGAIQTLLSGGSALDKIGWLKTPEKQPEPTKKPEAKPEKKKPTPSPKPERPLRASPGDLRDIGEIDDRQEEDISTEREPDAPEDRELRQERYEMGQSRIKRLLTQGELSEREAAILRRDLDQSYADLSREPKEPKQEPNAEGKPRTSLADQATKLKLKELKELPLSKLRSMQAALQKHPKFNNPAYSDGKKYDKALRAVEGAIYSKV